MRILIISNYYPPFEIGGWGQLTQNVADRLQDRGHQVCVLASNYRAEELVDAEPDVCRLLHLESPDHVHYHPHYSFTQTRLESENRKILVHTAIEFAPDIIFINGMWNMPHTVARTAEVLRPGRVAYYMASSWPMEQDAHTAYWMDLPTAAWKRWPKAVMGALIRKMFIPGTPRNDLDFPLVLCVSRFIQDKMVQEADIPCHRTRVVHNGVDLADFPPIVTQNGHPTLRLLYAGRLSPDKGVHTIIESLPYLRERPLPLSIRITIVGSGAIEYEDHLRRLVDELDIADMIQFRGQVPREKMPGILAEQAVLLFPSIWEEPLARMVQEAMASGLVVIGTETGGTPEILHDGINGMTFPAGDAEALARKIARVAGDESLRHRLAQAARFTVAEKFTMDRMVDEIENQLGALLRAATAEMA